MSVRITWSLLVAIAVIVVATGNATAAFGGLPPSALPGAKALEEVQQMVMPQVDVESLLADDVLREGAGRPVAPRYAQGLPVTWTPDNSGTWETLADGSHIWRLRITSPGALSLSLGLSRFELPAGAALWIHDTEGAQVQGPYTVANRNAAGGLWTAIVLGDEVVVELELSSGARRVPELEISSVNHGYRFFGAHGAAADLKRGSCNVNVTCPEGNRWRDQIRSVALIAFTSGGQGFICTAQLVNNTAEDDTPYLLTAQHCIDAPEVAPTIVAYWNYETATCDDFFGGDRSQNQSGATLVASLPQSTESDFALVELDQQPDPAFDVFFAGWDARENPPQASVSIHHPGFLDFDQKSISFDADPVTVTSYLGTTSPGNGNFLRVADWDVGTTEKGSSGACLFDEQSGLCVGMLSGGFAACGNDQPDWYGRLHRQFAWGATPESRLSDWLDPLGTGALFLTGKDPGTKTRTTQAWLIPAAGSAPGVGTSNWKSQITVTNPSGETRNALVYFVEKASKWPGTLLSGPHMITPDESLFLDDPLLAENPTSGLMYVVVDGDGTAAFSRIYNLTTDGATFGQGMPAIPLNLATNSTELILPLVHSGPGHFRTNVGIIQTSSGVFGVNISIYSRSGELLAEKGYQSKNAWWQINDIFGKVGIGDLTVEGGWIRVTLVKGSPAFWTTYATVIDAQTDDPTYVQPVAP